MLNILIQRHLEKDVIDRFNKEYGVNLICTDGENFPSKEILDTIEVYVGWRASKALNEIANLKWVHVFSAGVDNPSKSIKASAKRPRLTNNRGTYAAPLTEHIFALLLAVNRKMKVYAINQQANKWEYAGKVKEIHSSTVGVVGFGDVGKHTAKVAKAFGATVYVNKLNEIEKPSFVDGVYYGNAGLDEMLPLCDSVLINLPGTEQTKHLFNRQRMLKMKKGAVIVNVGRGFIIDCEALCDLIESEHIGGAGLDVTDPEPIDKESRLWGLENVVITPHMAGSSPNSSKRTLAIFEDNLKCYINGDKMPNEIDLDRGY